MRYQLMFTNSNILWQIEVLWKTSKKQQQERIYFSAALIIYACVCAHVCVCACTRIHKFINFITMIMVIKSVWVLMRPWVIITDSWNDLLANRPQIIALTKGMDNKHSLLCAVITQPCLKNNYWLSKLSLSNYNPRFCTVGINHSCPKLVK